MIIKNGDVYINNEFVKSDLRIVDNAIYDIRSGFDYNKYDNADNDIMYDVIIDASDMYVIPGLVDIHFHGCAGFDFCDGTDESLDAITQYQVQNGITSIVPATMTLPENELEKIFANFVRYKNDKGSSIRGITMEGPFISIAKKGAQNSDYILKPNMEFFKKMQSLSGDMIKQVAIAPEEDKDFVFIKEISKKTVVSLAHTMADYDIADKALKSGATHITHLFNAMPGFSHREPAVVGAAFDNQNTFVELICDGIHVHQSVVRAMFKLFGSDRICMISDSMMATGMPDGNYMLGGQDVEVLGKKAILTDGTIAGSASNLYECLRTAVHEMNVPLADAVRACTDTPAKSLGIDKQCGCIDIGCEADLVIMDKALDIKYVIKSGKIIE